MRIETHDTYKELFPDEGKVLSNGRDTATRVAMPIAADHSMWHDIDEPEPGEPIDDSEALDIITGQAS